MRPEPEGLQFEQHEKHVSSIDYMYSLKLIIRATFYILNVSALYCTTERVLCDKISSGKRRIKGVHCSGASDQRSKEHSGIDRAVE